MENNRTKISSLVIGVVITALLGIAAVIFFLAARDKAPAENFEFTKPQELEPGKKPLRAKRDESISPSKWSIGEEGYNPPEPKDGDISEDIGTEQKASYNQTPPSKSSSSAVPPSKRRAVSPSHGNRGVSYTPPEPVNTALPSAPAYNPP